MEATIAPVEHAEEVRVGLVVMDADELAESVEDKCPDCGGTGWVSDTERGPSMHICPACKGTGQPTEIDMGDLATHHVDAVLAHMEESEACWLHGFDGRYGPLMRAVYLQQMARIWGLSTPEGAALMRESDAWLARWEREGARHD